MEITSIYRYNSAAELIMETFGDDVLDGLTDDERDFVMHADDYDPVSLYLLNVDTVAICDGIFGDVMGDLVSVEDFLSSVLLAARAEVEA